MKPLVTAALVFCACATTPETVLPKDAAQIATADLEKLVATPAPTSTNVPVNAVPLPTLEPLKLVLLPVANKPTIAFRLVFRTGSVDDPKGKEGLTALTAQVAIEGGAKDMTSAQLLEVLFPMAADLSARTDKEFTTITGRVHRDWLPRYLQVLSVVMQAPRFDETEFNRLKAEQLNLIRNRLRQEDDEGLSKVALDALLYEGHPYAHFVVGTEAGLAAISLDDVKAHWKRVFTQDRLLIGLAGAVDAKLGADVQGLLKGLPEKGDVRAPLPPAPGPQGRTWIVKRDTASTAGDFGFTIPLRRDSPEFLPLFIAMSALGEHRQQHGVLFQEVRERRGLNYGTYAYAQHYSQDGWESVPETNILRTQQDATVWLRPVPAETAVFATRTVLHFLEKSRTEPFSKEGFEASRGFLAGATRAWTSTDQRRLGWAMDDVISGTPDFLGSVRKALETITPAEAQLALQKHVSPASLNFVFVTRDAEGLAQKLKSGAPSPMTYPTPKPEDVLQDDQVIAREPLPLVPTDITIVDANALMVR